MGPRPSASASYRHSGATGNSGLSAWLPLSHLPCFFVDKTKWDVSDRKGSGGPCSRSFSFNGRLSPTCDALAVGIRFKKISWILDADIQGYFDSISHKWMIRFLEHRIADKRMLRLIRKWPKAGVIENGEWTASAEGFPQGFSISPLLANIYLHYVLDLWCSNGGDATHGAM